MGVSLKQVATGDLEHEFQMTRKMLAAVPSDKLSWQPHEKSWTMAGLATHLANLPTWITATIQTDGFDLEASPRRKTALEDVKSILSTFDINVAEALEALAEMDEEQLWNPWTLSYGEKEVFTQPKCSVLRSAGISHLVHHRAQLGIYLRLCNVPVPGTYGPTADEQSGKS